jgi:hypothetical protein
MNFRSLADFLIHAAHFALPKNGSKCWHDAMAKTQRNPFEIGGELCAFGRRIHSSPTGCGSRKPTKKRRSQRWLEIVGPIPSGSAVVSLMTDSAIDELTDCTAGIRDRWSRKNAS